MNPEPDNTDSDDTRDPDDIDGSATSATDSTTTEWFGQSVDSDAELADRLTREHGADDAERIFDQQARGADVERRRRGDDIDPELGEAAYREERPSHAAEPD